VYIYCRSFVFVNATKETLRSLCFAFYFLKNKNTSNGKQTHCIVRYNQHLKLIIELIWLSHTEYDKYIHVFIFLCSMNSMKVQYFKHCKCY